MPIPHDFFALAAAACWAFGSLLSVEPSRHLGAFAFTRWRMLSVAVMLWTTTLALSGLPITSFSHFGAMAFSGLIGIFVGDTALYSAMNRLGPRRAGILFATHAIIRVSIACGAHFFLLWLGVTVARPTRRPSLLVLAQTALSGLVSVALGMTLLLLALKFGDVGMVSILSSVTPILLLPLLWLRLHRPPAYGAWFGAATSILGTALILSR